MALTTGILYALCLGILVQGTPVVKPPLMRLAQSNNYLGINLLKTLSSDGKNVFLSPFSISTALAMVYAGSNGNTASEMRSVLGYNANSLSDDDLHQAFRSVTEALKFIPAEYTLNVANSALVHKSENILESYKDALREIFNAQISNVDFVNDAQAIVTQVNNWVSQATHQKIDKFLEEPLDPTTRLFLLNAIYFKGSWNTKFDKENTKERSFFNHGNDETKVSMMKRRDDFNVTFDNVLNSHVLEIPYKENLMSMVILLPSDRNGVNALKQKLSGEKLETVLSDLVSLNSEVYLPKFKFETSYKLVEPLKRIGLTEVFSSDSDLSLINGKKDLYVSGIQHKAVVEVNEEGSEAAAATGVEIRTRSGRITPRFIVDHPFLFFIRHVETGGILFAGQVNEL